MESLMEFAVDESKASTKYQKFNVIDDNAIVIGDNNNKNLMAISFENDGVFLDIDNTFKQFDFLVLAADKTMMNNRYLRFNVKNVIINPDFTINLELINSSIKTLEIRPDEIVRVNSKGLRTQVCQNNSLYNINLPEDLFQYKSQVKGLEAFPSQFTNLIANFKNSEVKDFTVDNKPYNIAKIQNNFYVTDGDFIRLCNIDNIKFSKEKDANIIQFDFGTSKKNLNNISDDAFGQICSFINKNSNDAKMNVSAEKINENKEVLQPSEEHVYIKSQALPNGLLPRFEKEKQDKLMEDQSKKSEKKSEKPKSEIKTEKIDLAFPLKLVGLFLFFIGFFGGPLLAMILGVCIGGTAYAFNSKLEEIKLPVGEKKPRKKYIVQKQKKENKISKKEIVQQRISSLQKYSTKIKKQQSKLEEILINQKNLITALTNKLSGATNEEKEKINTMLKECNSHLTKITQLKNDFDYQANIYFSLIEKSANDLTQILDVVDLSKDKLQKVYEDKYTQMLDAQNKKSDLYNQITNLTHKLSTASSETEKQTLQNQINNLNNQHSAQTNIYNTLYQQTMHSKDALSTFVQSEKIFADNLDGSIIHTNIENGLKIVDDFNNNIEEISQVFNKNKKIATKNKLIERSI